MADLMTPTYSKNMKIIGHTDQGSGRADGVQIMVHKGYAYVGHIFSKGFSVIDVKDPTKPKPVGFIPAPPNTWTLHLQQFNDLLLVVHAKDMFAQPELAADEKAYYKGKIDSHGDTVEEQTWSAGLAVYDVSKPEAPRQIGFMPVKGGGLHRLLVYRRTLGVRVGAARRVHRLHHDHDRSGGPDQADACRQVLAAGHEQGGRRGAELAASGRPLRAASPDHPRRHCVLLVGAMRVWPWSTSATAPRRN